jgi:hypothetical protein
MPITFTCDCGRTLKAEDQYAGKRTRCPGCSTVQTIPRMAPPDDDEVAEVLPTDEHITARRTEGGERRQRSTGAPAIRDVLPAEGPQKKARRRPRIDHDDEDLAQRKRRGTDSGSMLDKGALGGLGMMGIAIVWFVGGGLFGVWFIYPPILFVLGLIAFIKGLIDGR